MKNKKYLYIILFAFFLSMNAAAMKRTYDDVGEDWIQETSKNENITTELLKGNKNENIEVLTVYRESNSHQDSDSEETFLNDFFDIKEDRAHEIKIECDSSDKLSNKNNEAEVLSHQASNIEVRELYESNEYRKNGYSESTSEYLNETTRKQEKIYICGHSCWESSYGEFEIPKGIEITFYGPLGSALSKPLAKAIVAGEPINQNSITIRNMNPLTLINLGYDVPKCDNYDPKPLTDYPQTKSAGDRVPDFCIGNANEHRLEKQANEISVYCVEEGDKYLSEICQENPNCSLMFGGCSWVRENFATRAIVELKDKKLLDQYGEKLSQEEKLDRRRKKFRNDN